jgi:hypothetical protein
MTEEIDNILDYLQRTGLNTISTDSPAWKLLHNAKCQKNVKNLLTCQKIDISIGFEEKKLDNSIGFVNGQKLSVGDLVSHVTVPTLGYGLVVAESENHKDYWIVKWCDPRYHDVGQLGIQAKYLAKVN